MKKYILDLRVVSVEHPHERYVLLKATNPEGPLPEMRPGQFAQLRADGSKTTFLRRPISIHNVVRARDTYNDIDVQEAPQATPAQDEVWFLIATVGEGTCSFARLQPGDTLNVVLPLGNGFTMPEKAGERILLVGGGVGTAPLLYMGREMAAMGCKPTFLLGARSAGDLLQLDEFRKVGEVFVTTEDGSMGERGFVTQHTVLQERQFDRISTCGPKPMMMAVARFAKANGVQCEVSLENMMACGVGACLCCVEDTKPDGHVCVCKDGPVFDIDALKWELG